MDNRSQTSIVIVDDTPIVRYGLRDFLEKQNGMYVQAEACSAEEALDAVRSSKPDVVIMDTSSICDGDVMALEELTRSYGGKLLAYTNDSDWNSVQSFLGLGGKGVITKVAPLYELSEAIKELAEGRIYVSPSICPSYSPKGRKGSSGTEVISPREIEIAIMVVQGYTSIEIADRLFISRRTVETHRHKLMRKLGISSRAELVAYITAQHPQ